MYSHLDFFFSLISVQLKYTIAAGSIFPFIVFLAAPDGDGTNRTMDGWQSMMEELEAEADSDGFDDDGGMTAAAQMRDGIVPQAARPAHPRLPGDGTALT